MDEWFELGDYFWGVQNCTVEHLVNYRVYLDKHLYTRAAGNAFEYMEKNKSSSIATGPFDYPATYFEVGKLVEDLQLQAIPCAESGAVLDAVGLSPSVGLGMGVFVASAGILCLVIRRLCGV
jgi:hypothetical protein